MELEIEDDQQWYYDEQARQEKKLKLQNDIPKRLICIKCGEPTLDQGQDVSICGNCAN